MQAFVPKNRRPRFELGLRIVDLNNVPLVNGTAFVKWRLPSSSGAETNGHTDKAVIIDHRAYWNYERALQVRLTIDRNQSLHECELQFEIIQEFESGGGGDTKNFLGRIRLNLAEYVDKSDDDEGIVRRYLMQDSKVNSTLKVGIAMRQVEGERNFTTPPLKSAMVFGGITGVVSSEQTEPTDLGPLPSINMQSRETIDLQDMYRQTLAASWCSRSDDVPADKLVEELFSGSISWSNDVNDLESTEAKEGGHFPSTGAAMKGASSNRLSPTFERRPKSSSSSHFRNDGKLHDFNSRVGHNRKRSSIEHQLYGTAKGNAWKNRNNDRELTEFDVREDLRSWEIGVKE
ncbi:N-terminal C2 in EEIG1 and EHBP1 proteins-domain-containing protein [Aspergillus bertholletiae]|uniref:N-terminal C2 in EEIG1 and EHBP1 proteins-domain-containing protein n=1 Tax=Aspergillus bertholletiae TaxID=1226010 RepID=A0A5N7BP74_9EURO|nr:N-terminal C2 in EEIG1 and EHBP1 proteins-domain-containing protein [Aspergillus bertholletiae]